MPKNTRQWAIRELSAARNNLNWTGTHIESVRGLYAEPHPEIAEILEQAQEALILIDTLLERSIKCL